MNEYIAKIIKNKILLEKIKGKITTKTEIKLLNEVSNDLINKLLGGGSKKLKIDYLDETYIFEKVDDDISDIYILYSQKEENCVVLNIDKNEKIAQITNLTSTGIKCSDTLINNIGMHLVKITISVIKKYKDKFNINKILLTDHSFLFCNTIKKNIPLGDLQILKNGHTFYGQLGFVPFSDNDVQNKVLLSSYNKNIKIINNLTVLDSKIIYYLEKFQKKNIIDVTSLIASAYKYSNHKLSNFIKKLSQKNVFDDTCIVLNYIIQKIIHYNKIISFHNQQFYMDI
jgi:hypothetical protein